MGKIDYKTSGVDIDVANNVKKRMSEHVDDAPSSLSKFGDFASLIQLDLGGFSEPVLAYKTEEPGSKQVLAIENGCISGIASDLINHLINDLVCTGATPLAVQDAIIVGRINSEVVYGLVKAMADACRKNYCVLVGGETSEQPGVLGDNVHILTASAVGLVEKSRILRGENCRAGDRLIALSSSGPHTNGYSLIRKLLKEFPSIGSETVDGRNFVEAALEPHRAYYPILKEVIASGQVKAMAHITGGGIAENLNRSLSATVDAVVDLGCYRTPEIFKVIKRYSELDDSELLRTFNLGVGAVLVVDKGFADELIGSISGCEAYDIGSLVDGSGAVRLNGQIRW